MSHLLLVIALALPLVALAKNHHYANDPTFDCSDVDLTQYSHCVHFKDVLADPAEDGFLFRFSGSGELTDGTTITFPPAQACFSSQSQINIDKTMPHGKYMLNFEIGTLSADGSVSYKPLATDTFRHGAPVKDNPFTFAVNIGDRKSNCKKGPPQADFMTEFFSINQATH